MGCCSVTMATEFAALNPGRRRCISMSHAWHRLLLARGALPSLGPPRTGSAARMGCLGGLQLLARGWHSCGRALSLASVPGSPWQCHQARPARTCAVLWLPAPAAGRSLLPSLAKRLHPSGRQLAGGVWGWQGTQGCPWLPRSADFAGFCPDLTGRTRCLSQAGAGLCRPATLCKGTSFAFLPAGEKSDLHHFFHP